MADMAGFTERVAPDGTRFGPVHVVPETGSTNADLLAAAADGGAAGRVLVTDHQTAGRGRQRRAWHDEPGSSLLVSVLLRPPASQAPLIPLATGLAAVDAVGAVAPDRPAVGLKWPNDVLVPAAGERKLAGILSEATSSGGGDELVVVVGMGMNLRWSAAPPDEVATRAITVEEVAGHAVERDRVLDAFLVALERWLSALEAGPGFLDAYRSACLTIGRPVRFATATGEHRGLAVDVSSTGTLLMDTDAGERVELHAGDAHHL